MVIVLKVGQRVRVWVQGQSSPEEVEILELDVNGFPSHVEGIRDGQRHRYRRSRLMFWLMVHDGMMDGPAAAS